jgi:hypothetical protein
MSYLRRLVAKVQATTPRLVPRRPPSFGGVPASLEEHDEDIVVGAPVRNVPPSEPLGATAASPASPVDAQRVPPALEPRAEPDSAAGLPPTEVAEAPDALPSTTALPRRRARRPTAEQPAARVRPVETRTPGPARVRDDDDGPLVAPVPQRESRATQRMLAPVAEPLRREPPARAPANAALESTTVVNIAIGRIEVRAATAPAKQPREQPFRPRLTLEAHLAGAGDRR